MAVRGTVRLGSPYDPPMGSVSAIRRFGKRDDPGPHTNGRGSGSSCRFPAKGEGLRSIAEVKRPSEARSRRHAPVAKGSTP